MDHKKFLKIRSDPILWIAHMRKRSTLFHELTRQRAALRDPKRKARLHKVALKLGVLFIVSPGWAEAFERLRVAIITDHKTRLFEQANNSDLDLIDLVNLHYTD